MAAVSPTLCPTATPDARLTDSHGRVIHDLRVSITDRCNYKCVYCRTGEGGALYPELSIEEYLRLIGLFVGLGITKVRLTGGEPLLRRGLVELVEELARLHTLSGEPLDLALTTNGHLLGSLAAPLKAAGLNRVTVSMDAVDALTFERITRVPGSFQNVLGGIRAARAAGLTPLKINCVLLRGFNDGQIESFALFARQGTWWCGSLSSCRSRKAACGRRRSWSRSRRSWRASAAFCRWSSCRRASPVRRRAATPSPTARARSASSRPSARPSAGPAAGCGSPPTAKSAPASSPRWSTTCTGD